MREDLIVYQCEVVGYCVCMCLPDSNCVKMLDLGVVPHILDLLERHVDQGDVSIQHAGLSALRNLAIPGTPPPCVSFTEDES